MLVSLKAYFLLSPMGFWSIAGCPLVLSSSPFLLFSSAYMVYYHAPDSLVSTLDASMHTLITIILEAGAIIFSCLINGAQEKPSNVPKLPKLANGRQTSIWHAVYKICTLLSHPALSSVIVWMRNMYVPGAWVFGHRAPSWWDCWEVVDPLGDGTLLEEAYHWEQALSVYSVTLLSICFFSLVLWFKMWIWAYYYDHHDCHLLP